jgi:hypothetical protein
MPTFFQKKGTFLRFRDLIKVGAYEVTDAGNGRLQSQNDSGKYSQYA